MILEVVLNENGEILNTMIELQNLEAIRKWMSKDDRYLNMIGECEIIRNAVSILRRRTIGEGEEGEEGEEGKEGKEKEDGKEEEDEAGVSVSEKNGLLGIVLEVVEGGVWKGGYSELEEVVSRLEEVIYKVISNDSNAVDGLRCADKWRVGGEDKYGMNMSE